MSLWQWPEAIRRPHLPPWLSQWTARESSVFCAIREPRGLVVISSPLKRHSIPTCTTTTARTRNTRTQLGNTFLSSLHHPGICYLCMGMDFFFSKLASFPAFCSFIVSCFMTKNCLARRKIKSPQKYWGINISIPVFPMTKKVDLVEGFFYMM